MNISVICVGRLKEKFFKDAKDEYIKRLSRYCSISVIEVMDEKTPENATDKENEIIKDKEGEKILKNIKDNMHVITLEIKGKMLSSEELSDYMGKLMLDGISDIAFVIGGSLGLSQNVIKRSDYHLSFSNMTFPHQLMRIILLEQVYRSFKIMKGEPYHK